VAVSTALLATLPLWEHLPVMHAQRDAYTAAVQFSVMCVLQGMDTMSPATSAQPTCMLMAPMHLLAVAIA
jgi:hypothetical protein